MRLIIPGLALAASTMIGGCGAFNEAQHPAQVTLRLADAAMAAGAPEMALRVAEMVLQQQPNNVAAMVTKADALYATGALDGARAAYRQAVGIDPANGGAQIGLGRTLVRSDPQAAETAFLAALVHQPDSVLALNDLGIARDMQGHHAEAQEAYRRALVTSPESIDVQTNLGLSLALSGDRTKAVQLLQPVATAATSTPMQRANLAMAQASVVAPLGHSEAATPIQGADRATTQASVVAPSGLAEVAATPTPMQTADLVTAQPSAVAPFGHAEAPVRAGANGSALAISTAPRLEVHRETLLSQPVLPGPRAMAAETKGAPATIIRTDPAVAVAGTKVIDPIVQLGNAFMDEPGAASPPVAAVQAPDGSPQTVWPVVVAKDVVPTPAPVAPLADLGRSQRGFLPTGRPVAAKSLMLASRVDPAAVVADARSHEPIVSPYEPIGIAGDTVVVGPAVVPRPDLFSRSAQPAGPQLVLASQERETEPVAPTPTTPPAGKELIRGDYYVQIGALDSAEAASSEWQKMRARWPDLLGDRTPALQQADVHDRTYWRLCTGVFSNVGGASDFCMRLRAVGSNCWVGVASRD